MTCGHCVAGVKRALEAVPGVESADVSLADGRASVRGTAALPTLVGAVEEEGYSAAPMDSASAPAELEGSGESCSRCQLGGNASEEE